MLVATCPHASLQNADAVLTHVRGILTTPAALGSLRAAAPVVVGLDLDDVYRSDEPVVIAAAPSDRGEDLSLAVHDTATGAQVAAAQLPRTNDRWRRAELRPLPAGAIGPS